jgi:hypothetical protein
VRSAFAKYLDAMRELIDRVQTRLKKGVERRLVDKA